MYTNFMLTVIALVMLAMAAQQLGINVLGTAQAQRKNIKEDLNKTATGVTIDTTIPQTQDVAVAQATSEVASANREIALAIRELGTAIRDGATDVKGAMDHTRSATGATPATAVPVEPVGKPTIEVR
jgi:hypothetical protein